MNYLVIYPGRFHPFHRGHRASYEYLAKKYGEDHVYIATTGVQAPVTSPFSFSDKVKMISTLGIPAGHVVKVTNPYQSREITDKIPEEEKANTVLIFALSAKDAERFNFAPKRDGSPSYLQPMPKNLKQLKPMTDHAYVEIVPTVNFKVHGRDANSASQIREFYIKGNNNDRDQIIADLYGEAYPELRDIFDDRLGVTEQVQKIVREARSIKTERSIALLESILIKERGALNEFAQGVVEATGDPKFDKMLKSITGKRAVAKQQKADTKQQARDAFGGMFGGGNPADQLGIKKKGVAESERPANTLYFFDVGRGGRSFTNSDLLALGLRQSKGGRWYYKPGTTTSAERLKSTLAQLTNRLNIAPKAWQPPATESIRDVFGFGVKKPPAKKPAPPVDDFTAKMIANKQKNLKIVQPKDVYHSPEEYTQATGNKIKESADYLEEK